MSELTPRTSLIRAAMIDNPEIRARTYDGLTIFSGLIDGVCRDDDEHGFSYLDMGIRMKDVPMFVIAYLLGRFSAQGLSSDELRSFIGENDQAFREHLHELPGDLDRYVHTTTDGETCYTSQPDRHFDYHEPQYLYCLCGERLLRWEGKKVRED